MKYRANLLSDCLRLISSDVNIEKGASISCDGSSPNRFPAYKFGDSEVPGGHGGVALGVSISKTYGSLFVPTEMGMLSFSHLNINHIKNKCNSFIINKSNRTLSHSYYKNLI